MVLAAELMLLSASSLMGVPIDSAGALPALLLRLWISIDEYSSFHRFESFSVQKAGGKASCTLLLHDVSERESIRISRQSNQRDYLKSPENIARYADQFCPV
jgi:hypothetical protein